MKGTSLGPDRNHVGFALASMRTMTNLRSLPTRRDNEMLKKRLDKPNPIRAGAYQFGLQFAGEATDEADA
jgi:hypothetical protein